MSKQICPSTWTVVSQADRRDHVVHWRPGMALLVVLQWGVFGRTWTAESVRARVHRHCGAEGGLAWYQGREPGSESDIDGVAILPHALLGLDLRRSARG